MSTIFADIEAALVTHLNSLSSRPAVAFPNVKFEPNPKNAFVKIDILGGATEQAGLGEDGKDETNGICQLSVFVPTGTGRSTIPDQLADHFKRGTILTSNSTVVRLRSPSIGSSIADGAFYLVPVSIPYQTYTEART